MHKTAGCLVQSCLQLFVEIKLLQVRIGKMGANWEDEAAFAIFQKLFVPRVDVLVSGCHRID